MKPFVSNEYPTLGIEEEFQIVDKASWRLVQDRDVHDVITQLDEEMKDRVCFEVFDCVIENRSGVCRDVGSLVAQVIQGRQALKNACDKLGLAIVAAGSYPFADWREQQFVDTTHYQWLKDNYYYLAKRLMAFSVHVHVGVKSEEAAFYIMNEMKRWIYPILALSANSPFYDDFNTGMDSTRTHLFHSLPRTLFAPDFKSHEELVHHYSKLVESGDVLRPGDLWWMIRPPLPLGTVEYRVCDLPTDYHIIGALAAIFQAATLYYQKQFYSGVPRTVIINEHLEQNCWRCTKDSLDAKVIDPVTEEVLLVKEQLTRFFDLIEDHAVELKCGHHLDYARELLITGNEAAKQKRRLIELGGSFNGLIKELAQQTVT